MTLCNASHEGFEQAAYSSLDIFLGFSKDEVNFKNLVEASGGCSPGSFPFRSAIRRDFKQKIAVGFTAQWRCIIDYWAKTGKRRCFSLCSSSVAAGQMGFVFGNSTLWRKNNRADGEGTDEQTDEDERKLESDVKLIGRVNHSGQTIAGGAVGGEVRRNTRLASV